MPRSAVVSETCRLCNQDQCTQWQQPDHITTCHITAAGDWLSEATLLGLSGPKGRHFCNFCNATLNTLRKGQPQSPVIFPRYRLIPDPQHPSIFELRTLEDIWHGNQAFQLVGSNASRVADFNNCLHQRIIPGSGSTLEAISCTPLHVFLGLGDQAVKIVERQAAVLDKSFKQLTCLI